MIQAGANGDVQFGRRRVVLEHLEPLADVERPGRSSGCSIPIWARQWFIAHCRRSGASFISASMTSSSPGRSRTSGVFATRSVVSAQPALATTGIRVADQASAQLLGVRALLDDVAHQPVVHLGSPRLAQHGVQLVAAERLGAADQQRQQPGCGVAGAHSSTASSCWVFSRVAIARSLPRLTPWSSPWRAFTSRTRGPRARRARPAARAPSSPVSAVGAIVRTAGSGAGPGRPHRGCSPRSPAPAGRRPPRSCG